MLEECRHLKAGAAERLRIALLNVDYVTSFELPFRLLLIRTPQLIAGLRDELQLSQKEALFNGKRFGCVWSLCSDLSAINGIRKAYALAWAFTSLTAGGRILSYECVSR